jgi:hypothetical protein
VPIAGSLLLVGYLQIVVSGAVDRLAEVDKRLAEHCMCLRGKVEAEVAEESSNMKAVRKVPG